MARSLEDWVGRPVEAWGLHEDPEAKGQEKMANIELRFGLYWL